MGGHQGEQATTRSKGDEEREFEGKPLGTGALLGHGLDVLLGGKLDLGHTVRELEGGDSLVVVGGARVQRGNHDGLGVHAQGLSQQPERGKESTGQ